MSAYTLLRPHLLRGSGLNADIRNLYEIVNELHEIAVAAAGGSISTTRLSQGALSALRVVRDAGDGVHVHRADCADQALIKGILGLATTAVSGAEERVDILQMGVITDSSWNWTPGAVFLGTEGTLTQVAPQIIVVVGEALSAHTLFVQRRGTPVVRL